MIPDPPVKGIDKVIAFLRTKKNFRITVLTTRALTEEGRLAVENYLLRHGIEVDCVTSNKPPAICYVDDRAVRFTGDVDQLLNDLEKCEK